MLNSLTHAPKGSRPFRSMLVAVALASTLLLQPFSAAFAVNFNTVETPVTQNFDSIGATTTATLPADFKVDKFSTAATVRTLGTYAAAGTQTEQSGSQLTSTSQQGIWNFGSGSSNTGTDRAVGFLASGSGTSSGNLYAKYTNTTGASLTALRVAYDIEKYRTGTRNWIIQLYYSTDGATWTSAGSSFLNTFAAEAALAGCNPAPCSTTSVTSQLLSIPTVANNADIYLAWNYSVATGTTFSSAPALGIDNISVTPLGGSIGSTGVRTTDVQGTDDGAFAMALQPDGKIVVGGYAVNVSGNKDFALLRYNYNGTLDTTFGTGGKVTTDFNGTSDRIWGLTLQSDGKIVAVGETFNVVYQNNDVAMARYTSAGALDATFGTGGKVVNDGQGLNTGANNSAYGVAMSGTNIVVVGTESVNGNLDFLVQRYTSAGALDPTFGNTLSTPGETTTGFSGYNDVARSVAVDNQSKIVVGGYANNGSDDDFAVARYTTAGVLDPNFVLNAGKAALNLGPGSSADQAFALALDSSSPQKIILAGSSYNPYTGNKDFALVRYLNSGVLDTANFGSIAHPGIVTTDFDNSPDVAESLYVRSDGFIVAGGFSRYSTSSDDFAIARYTPNGSLDPTLNGTGKLTTRISNADERIYAVAREFDGKIVAAGYAAVPGVTPVTRNFALARFNADGSLDATTATALNGPDLLLGITGPDDPNTVITGDSYTYNITVTNRGLGNATNVVITDPLPAGVGYVSSTQSTGTLSQSNGVVTNNVGVLNAGATATLSITVSTGATLGLVSNTATATLAETDISPSNNSATEYTRIIGLTDMSFVPSTVIGGCQNSTGTVTLSGEAPAGGATVNIVTADASATPPSSVVVPAGARSANFTVTTQPVAANKTVRMEATLGTTSFVRRLIVATGACN